MKTNPFTLVYNDIRGIVAYDPAWENGTGYLDHAVELVPMDPGERAKSIDPNGRKIIFVGTRFGNVVLFQRYDAKSELDVFNVTSNTSYKMRPFVSAGYLTREEILAYCGYDHSNIGFDIERLFA